MNTHDIDIKLPEPAFTAGTKIGTTTGFFCRDSKIRKGDGGYTREQVIAAIEPYVKRIAELEAASIAYASEFPPDENGDPDVGSIHENIRKLKAELESANAELERLCDETYVTQGVDAYNLACEEMEDWQTERRKAGKEVGTTGSLCDGIRWLYGYIEELEADRQHRGEPVSKTDWNNELSSWSEEDFICIFHERPDLANRLRKMLAEPVKGVICGPNGFIATTTNPEPVKVPSDADAKHIQDFIACDGMGAVIVEGPQYSAVVRALLSRYGQAAYQGGSNEK